ncbi:hypothetical protein JN00_0244 [Metamycoplasma subdolum]|uniref:Uncharacterized protein n=1 Tax=Metamycoplasma subdolum TaxID=92407 RepID=A0A3M0A0S1_9BACT|nr:hypothetical protein JN00_0244 [Metamycoplasma subdolum]
MNKKIKIIIIHTSILLSLLFLVLLTTFWKLAEDIVILKPYSPGQPFTYYLETTMGALNFVFLVFIVFLSIFIIIELETIPNFKKYRIWYLTLSSLSLLLFIVFISLFIKSLLITYAYLNLLYSVLRIVISIIFVSFISCFIYQLKKKTLFTFFKISELNL